MRRSLLRAAALSFGMLSAPLFAAEPVDLDAMNRIREEGFHRSQAMATLETLTDRLGPRLTASPEARAAADWAAARLREWGLQNVHLEPFEYGQGWSFSKSAVRVMAPYVLPVFALPKAWTPGTAGAVRAAAVHVTLETPDDLAEQKGKLRGKVVLLSGLREPAKADPESPAKPEEPMRRYSRGELDELLRFEIPGEKRDDRRGRFLKRWKFGEALNKFLADEGVVATVEMSRRDNGVIGVQSGGSRGLAGRSLGVPGVVMAAEPYQRLLRLLDDDTAVELELDVETAFHSADTHGYNVIGELPGGDRKDEVVMLGAHLDSWHAGTGATDDGAGVVAVMEALRILRASGLKPRRTVRAALWTGEEQGDIGSAAYVAEHFASRPAPGDAEEAELPPFLRAETWPIATKPEHARLSAYFNLDNGSGKIRGIYTQGNAALVPVFSAWLEPLRDLGADTVSTQDTGATDHESFDNVGLPGFQFIQDELDYESRTHHSNLDTYEHAHREDLMQASVVLAAFAYDAAQRDQLLARKPMPQAPPPSKKAKRDADAKAAAQMPATPPKP